MTRTVRLRPWQKAALEKFVASDQPDFLAVATPGAGKTTFALTAARHVLADRPRGRLVVVAPTAHLKLQWARAASKFALHLDPEWSAADGRLPADMHGIVTTYQQVASSAEVLRGLVPEAFVVFDEIHHAGDDRAWGQAVLHAFSGAHRRLAISGTPFRSDTRAIPFVRYVLDEASPDFEYGYGEALTDRRVVRPVYFPRTNGHMEWTAPDGALHAASFDDALDQARSSQRLRTALSLEGEWLPSVLHAAVSQLDAVRELHPEAGGLVVATDQDHARGIAALLRDRFGQQATVVTSDDPAASGLIARFAAGTDPWLVAVRMVSEGVDIPRLRVGVFATTTTTELFFRQAVGRLVRWTPGVKQQKSYLFIPDDPRLRARAFQIADQRRHSLRRREQERQERDPAALDPRRRGAALVVRGPVGGGHRAPRPLRQPRRRGRRSRPRPSTACWTTTPSCCWRWPRRRHCRATGRACPSWASSSAATPPARGAKRSVGSREQNAEIVATLVRRTGQTHAQVNNELNRLSGVGRITEATVAQLRTRLQVAERLAR